MVDLTVADCQSRDVVDLRRTVSEYFVDPLCMQVHGVVNDTIAFVQNIINTEINSATDNPVSFTDV